MLADRSQLPRSYIADIEGERRNPSLRTLIRVSNALGINLTTSYSSSCQPHNSRSQLLGFTTGCNIPKRMIQE